MADAQLNVIVELKDRISKELDRVQSKIETNAESIRKTGVAMTAMGGAIIGSFALAVKSAGDFEKSISNISTLISGDSTEAMAKLSDGIKEIMKSSPKSAEDLGSAAYDIFSAGITDTALALEVLRRSSDLATGGLGTTKEATDLMTSSLNAFASQGITAEQASEILFRTVKAGKTTVSELAQSFGMVAPIAATMGVKLADLQAATAALTTVGLSASVAQTQLRAAMTSLLKPTEAMSFYLDQLGVKSGTELIQKTGSLVNAFQAIKDTIGEKGNALGIPDLNTELASVFGSVEGLNAVLSLTGEQGEIYAATVESMVTETGALDEAVKKQSETFDANMKIVGNQINILAIEIGNVLLPIIKDLLQALVPIIEKVVEWIKEHPKLTQVIIIATAAIGALLLILGPLLIMLPGLVIAFTAVSAVIVGISAPIAIAIAAVIAIIAIGILLVKNWEMIKKKAAEIWTNITETIKNNWQNIVEFTINPLGFIVKQVIKNWDVIKESTNAIWTSVGGIISGVWEGIKNTVKAGINYVIDKINSFIRLANSVTSVVSKIGVSIPAIPEIPRLAKGGIVTKPTLAMVGEAGPEAVIPLNRSRSGGFGGNITIIVNGDVTGQDIIDRVGDALIKKLQLSTATV